MHVYGNKEFYQKEEVGFFSIDDYRLKKIFDTFQLTQKMFNRLKQFGQVLRVRNRSFSPTT